MRAAARSPSPTPDTWSPPVNWANTCSRTRRRSPPNGPSTRSAAPSRSSRSPSTRPTTPATVSCSSRSSPRGPPPRSNRPSATRSGTSSTRSPTRAPATSSPTSPVRCPPGSSSTSSGCRAPTSTDCSPGGRSSSSSRTCPALNEQPPEAMQSAAELFGYVSAHVAECRANPRHRPAPRPVRRARRRAVHRRGGRRPLLLLRPGQRRLGDQRAQPDVRQARRPARAAPGHRRRPVPHPASTIEEMLRVDPANAVVPASPPRTSSSSASPSRPAPR